MSEQWKDGGPAFPCDAEWFEGQEVWPASHGMSLRDWFAGHALAGLLAGGKSSTWNYDAANAYRAADAMLAARGATDAS